MASVTHVNSLDLPALLVALIGSNRWCPPDDRSVFDTFVDEHSGVTFYSTSQMEKETSWWLSLAVDGSCFRGNADSAHSPGDMEPSKTVLIGDVGIGFDAPFALDYRTSTVNPRIIHYRWHEDNKHSRWVEIAPNLSFFLNALNL
ncbi:hypothetical protein [Novipirellula artificiosorum]|nr:hypothetical protein [Novipirellula artificiosorum]